MFVNIGKAIAAYERRIQYGPSRFDRFVAAWKERGATPKDMLSSDEIAGLALFMGKANCTQCHNGPLLTNNEFHNTGVPRAPGCRRIAAGSRGAAAVKADEFNCRSRWSDAKPGECAELDALPGARRGAGARLQGAVAAQRRGARAVHARRPVRHARRRCSSTTTRRPAAPAGHSELKPLGLSRAELRQLEAFLRTLSGPLDAPARYLRAPQEPRS